MNWILNFQHILSQSLFVKLSQSLVKLQGSWPNLFPDLSPNSVPLFTYFFLIRCIKFLTNYAAHSFSKHKLKQIASYGSEHKKIWSRNDSAKHFFPIFLFLFQLVFSVVLHCFVLLFICSSISPFNIEFPQFILAFSPFKFVFYRLNINLNHLKINLHRLTLWFLCFLCFSTSLSYKKI